jgi:hypothetical protein
MRNLKWVALALAVASASCGGDDENAMCGDGGCPTNDGGGGGGMQWGLTSGTNNYKITSTTMVMDGCDVGPNEATMLPLTYTGGVVSLGNVMGTPPQPSLGTGTASGNKATLTSDNIVGDAAAMCTYSRKITSQFELIGHDKFTLMVTEKESMFSTGCGADVPPGGMCTSTWTWTFEKM